MRVRTKLQTISFSMVVILAVLLTAAFLLFIDTRGTRNNFKLVDEIQGNFLERTSIRDQYFIHREEHMVTRWDENKQKSDQLLRQAKIQFKEKGYEQLIDALVRENDENSLIFHRIAANSRAMISAAGNREVQDELDKRLSSQLILKATAVRDRVLTLKDLCTQSVERSYRYMIFMVFLFAGALALGTLVFSASLMRLIRLRLIPLHEGTRNIGDGDLECRIKISGSDEFTDLAQSINAMTDKLSVEIATRIETEEELQHTKAAEQERKRSEEAIRSLFEWTPVATIVHRDGKIIYTNPTAIKMFGARSQQDLYDRPFLALMHKDFHSESLERMALIDQGIAIPMMESKFIILDGTTIEAERRVSS